MAVSFYKDANNWKINGNPEPTNTYRALYSSDNSKVTVVLPGVGQYPLFDRTLITEIEKNTTGDLYADFAEFDKEAGDFFIGAGSVEPKDYMLEVVVGNVTGERAVHKFGSNLNSAANTVEDVLDTGGVYIYPTVSADMTHINQDVDQANMRGKDIEVDGLDFNWDRVVQIAVLDASDTSVPVALTTPLFRINTMQVQANLKATSNIRLHNAGDTLTYSQITPINNRTLQTHYSVERGSTALMTNVYGDVVESTGKEPKSTEFNLWSANRKDDWDFQLESARGVPKAGPAALHYFKPYLEIPEMHDIKITARCTDEPGHVHAGFDLIIREN